MPLDMNLMYGEMAGSAALHGILPILFFTIISTFNTKLIGLSNMQYMLILLAFCSITSFAVNFAFLTGLQASTCGGVKNISSISAGAGLGALITAVLVALPANMEWARLMVTSVFGMKHNILLSEQDVKNQDILQGAAAKIFDTPDQETVKQTAQTQVVQTRREIAVGSIYWMAFAGAYGIAAGSMISASTCGV